MLLAKPADARIWAKIRRLLDLPCRMAVFSLRVGMAEEERVEEFFGIASFATIQEETAAVFRILNVIIAFCMETAP